MRRVHHQKHQLYQQKDFEIQSLNSLVRNAKQKTCERLGTDRLGGTSDGNLLVKLPLHDITERIMDGLQQMHHQVQNLVMQKLGSDARNIITAERSRQASADMRRLEAKAKKEQYEGYIAPHLSEIGEVHGADELELLNEYRSRYATIVAELLVAKERLVDL